MPCKYWGNVVKCYDVVVKDALDTLSLRTANGSKVACFELRRERVRENVEDTA